MATEISTKEQLKNIENNLAGNYILVNDIDLGGEVFETIEGYFSGTFDGQNYKIYNGDIGWGGVFENLSGTIENLVLEVHCSGHAALVHHAENFTLIENCHWIGSGDCSFIYEADYGEVRYCSVNRSGTGSQSLFCNWGFHVAYYRCIVKGNVSGTGWGVCCFGDAAGYFLECGSEGNVSGTEGWAGGFCGSPGSASPPDHTVYERCYHKGNVSGSDRQNGGFNGVTNWVCEFIDCYVVGDSVTASRGGGGFSAYLFQDDLEGISISNCYSTPIVSVDEGESGGPFADYLWPYNAWENCYYLDAPEQVEPEDEWQMQGDPLTLNQMKQSSSFGGFDFTNVWGIDSERNDGFPFLLWELIYIGPISPLNIWVFESGSFKSIDLATKISGLFKDNAGVWVKKGGKFRSV